jgi:predicted transcriptional regulator
MDTDLTKKTTILLSPELHRRLADLARRRHVSMGELIRHAVAVQYGVGGHEQRVRAVEALARLELPVSGVEDMKREAMADPEELLP